VAPDSGQGAARSATPVCICASAGIGVDPDGLDVEGIHVIHFRIEMAEDWIAIEKRCPTGTLPQGLPEITLGQEVHSMSDPSIEPDRTWHDIAMEMSAELDPKKMIRLAEELNSALERDEATRAQSLNHIQP
jgi:hypothetical protein